MKSIISRDTRLLKAQLTTISNLLCQLVVIITGIVSIPLILEYAGKADYSLWVVLTTILSFLTFSDLGLGIGLQDKLSKLIAIKDYCECRKIIVTAIATTFIIVFFIQLFIFIFLYSHSYNSIYYSVCMIFSLGVLSGIISRIFSALQEGFIIALIQLFSRLLSFFLLYVCIDLKVEFSVLIFLVNGLVYCLIPTLGFLYLIIVKNHLVGSFIKSYEIQSLFGLMKVGFWGLGASVAIYLVNNTGPYLVSLNSSPDVIVFYSVILKIITIPIMVLNFIFLPLWPAIADAYIKKDVEWLYVTFIKMKKYIYISFVFFPLIIFLGYEKIIQLWLGSHNIIFNNEILYILIFFMLLSFWNAYLTTILNGFSMYKIQSTTCLLIAFLSFLISLLYSCFFENYIFSLLIIIFGYLIRCIVLHVEVKKMIGEIYDY